MLDDTRSRLLHEAEVLIRTRGYSAFSYADLSERVRVRKASVHYYFPTKADLIVVLVREYIERFVAALQDIRQRHAHAGDRLRAYSRLFLDGFEKGMLPLCGALSAERAALPDAMHAVVAHFFQLHLDWLEGVLDDGIAARTLRADAAPGRVAMLLLSTLEGGSFVGWALQKKAPVLAAFEAALGEIEIAAKPPRRTSPAPAQRITPRRRNEEKPARAHQTLRRPKAAGTSSPSKRKKT
ncbi:MAG TPA: TetR/AcrR family transcriptional regulator [Dokdonella sp.]